MNANKQSIVLDLGGMSECVQKLLLVIGSLRHGVAEETDIEIPFIPRRPPASIVRWFSMSLMALDVMLLTHFDILFVSLLCL
jgi:hypothetical protein